MLPSPWWPQRAELRSPIPVIIPPPQRSMPRPSLHVSLWRTCIIHDLITTSSGDGRRSTLSLMGVCRIMACHCCDFLTMREKHHVLGLIKLLWVWSQKETKTVQFWLNTVEMFETLRRLAFHHGSICCLFKLVGFQCFSYLSKAKRNVCVCVCVCLWGLPHICGAICLSSLWARPAVFISWQDRNGWILIKEIIDRFKKNNEWLKTQQ